jgi:transcriptional regulator with XRE-family HTH domain
VKRLTAHAGHFFWAVRMEFSAMTIRKLRQLAGLTQLELARDAGVDRAKLSLVESGYIAFGKNETAAVRKAAVNALRRRQAEILMVLQRVSE